MPTITATVSHETASEMLMTGNLMEKLRAERDTRLTALREEATNIRIAKNPGGTEVRKSIHESRRLKQLRDMELRMRAMETALTQPAVAGALINVAIKHIGKLEKHIIDQLAGHPPTRGRPRTKKRDWNKWDEPIKFAFPKR